MNSSDPTTQQITSDVTNGANISTTDSSNYEDWMIAVELAVAISCLVMCGVGIFFMVSIFRLRKFTFNLYIIFAILPDSLCIGILGVCLFYEALHGGFMLLFLCEWMCFQCFFFLLANLYVNAVIAKEVLALVQSSYHRKRLPPPPTSKVLRQVGLIYACMALFSGWLVAPLSWNFISIENDPVCLSRHTNVFGGMVPAF